MARLKLRVDRFLLDVGSLGLRRWSRNYLSLFISKWIGNKELCSLCFNSINPSDEVLCLEPTLENLTSSNPDFPHLASQSNQETNPSHQPKHSIETV